jgi:sugar lactone lactonase YvrE
LGGASGSGGATSSGSSNGGNSGSSGGGSGSSAGSGGTTGQQVYEVTTLAGTDDASVDVDGAGGPSGPARFGGAGSVALNAQGDLFIANIESVRELSAAGIASTVTSRGYGFEDGPAASARFDQVAGVAVGSDGSVYVADEENCRIRKIDPARNVTTVAGNGHCGSNDGTGGPNGTATFDGPRSVAVDASGRIVVIDSFAVRRIDTDGTVSTLLETGDSIDGTAGPGGTALVSYWMSAVAADRNGNVFIAEPNAVRKLDPSGQVTTVARNPECTAADDQLGVGGPAFCSLSAIAVAPDGSIYVADNARHLIRKVTQSGQVTRVAGTGTQGFHDGDSDVAQFEGPRGLAVDAAGAIYVGDYSAIRKVTPVAP